MLAPKKVFSGKTGNGYSDVFCGQWYPNVTAQISRTGGTSHGAQLQGSTDGVAWADVGSAITGTFGTNNVSGIVYFLHWRLNLTSNNGTIDAWIGAGGA